LIAIFINENRDDLSIYTEISALRIVQKQIAFPSFSFKWSLTDKPSAFRSSVIYKSVVNSKPFTITRGFKYHLSFAMLIPLRKFRSSATLEKEEDVQGLTFTQIDTLSTMANIINILQQVEALRS
jgi:hypothetical protein